MGATLRSMRGVESGGHRVRMCVCVSMSLLRTVSPASAGYNSAFIIAFLPCTTARVIKKYASRCVHFLGVTGAKCTRGGLGPRRRAGAVTRVTLVTGKIHGREEGGGNFFLCRRRREKKIGAAPPRGGCSERVTRVTPSRCSQAEQVCFCACASQVRRKVSRGDLPVDASPHRRCTPGVALRVRPLRRDKWARWCLRARSRWHASHSRLRAAAGWTTNRTTLGLHAARCVGDCDDATRGARWAVLRRSDGRPRLLRLT